MKIESRKQGRLAHGSKSKRIAIRCPEHIADSLAAIAKEHNVSVSAVVLAALKQFTAEK